MKNGKCPKYNGNNIYRSKNYYGERYVINFSSFSHPLPMTLYICSDCNYFEEYIENSEHLKKQLDKYCDKV